MLSEVLSCKKLNRQNLLNVAKVIICQQSQIKYKIKEK